jgi:hypothetical protein
MKFDIRWENKNIMIIAITTAIIMISTCCASPTAVMILSNEKIISTRMIWAITEPKDAPAFFLMFSSVNSSPSSFPWISLTVL